MSAPTKIAICGAANAEFAGLVRACQRAGENWNLVGYVDDDEEKHGKELPGGRVLGPIDALEEAALAGVLVLNSIGSPSVRQRLAERFGERMVGLVHPAVELWNDTCGRGMTVLQGAIVSPSASIGEHVLIQSNAYVAHDVVLGDYANVSPGVLVNGRCRVETRAFVGAGAVLLPDVVVGSDALVGAGSVVTKPVSPGSVVYGNPARQRP
jgi:sugar O-acyltransferase (sialic acid O-acetyltransferase NeuD family)